MDCDDLTLLIARGSGSWSDAEADAVDAHVETCDACFEQVRAEPQLREAAPGPLVLRPVAADDLVIGDTIATGGMGQISRAYDRRLGREVAVKIAHGSATRARFEREAAITARLQHPAIVPIYEAGTLPDGSAFYTMPLVPGETLASAIARCATLTERLALLPHAIAVAEAVASAHARDVIHRDLKPHNVLIGEFGETVVIDWGLAKQIGRPDEAGGIAPAPGVHGAAGTRAGTVLGTPCFLAPEQARGAPSDARADVFALGALLYHVIAGEPPYWDRTHDAEELLAAVLAGPPTPIAQRAPGAPVDLYAIVERAMTREPAARYADAGELAAELRRFSSGQLLLARTYPLRERLARWVRRHRTLVGVVGAAVVVLGVVAGLALRSAAEAREAERAASRASAEGELRGQRKLCAANAPWLASPWTADAQRGVHHRFEQLGLSYAKDTIARVDADLARWSSELERSREQVCAAPAPRGALAAEVDCLTERVRRARALIAQLLYATAAEVQLAASAVAALPPIATCTAATPSVEPAPPGPAVTAIRDRFAETDALLLLGKAREALPIARELVAGADALGDPSLRAATRVELGGALFGTSDHEHAVPVLREAIRIAELARDDRTRALAWINLVTSEYQRGHMAEVIALEDAALGAAERVDDVYLETELLMFVGGAYDQRGDSAAAERRLARAVEQRRAAFGAQDDRVAAAMSALGNTYAMRGDLTRGIPLHVEAAAITEAAFGATHPRVGTLIGNLGSDYLYALRVPEAITQLQRAIAIAEATHGATHRSVGSLLTELGTAHLVAGDPAAALAAFNRADAIWQAVGAQHPTRAEALTGRYRAQIALHLPARIADLETALGLADALPPFIRARVELTLGEAITGPRARSLVEASAKGFATSTLPLVQRGLAEANAWLASHGGGAR